MKSLPRYLQARKDGVCVSVKVQPRASRNEIAGALGNELKIRVTAPPVDSAANQSLIEFLAEVLDCPQRALEILRGHASRHKQVFVRGLSAEQIAVKLNS
ncbi:MAG: DUF167 domain-containing protein [Verrucomicrobia subdivision 3 bacterium]|nr:DUF167 domain-containing protein [Limisphaerales bacterium]